jgi:hypothetical protein
MKSSIAFRAFLACALAVAPSAQAQVTSEKDLRADRPDSYTVQKGDTLWGISGRFLNEPWRWPEIWRMNRDQIRNPHRIYPGNVIVLDKVDGQFQLRLASGSEAVRLSPQVRVSELERQAIPSIPAEDLEPWLTRSLIVTDDFFNSAAKIVSARDQKMLLSRGDAVYAFGIDPARGQTWDIYRRGAPVYAFGARNVLGYSAIYLGSARLDRAGDVSRLIIDAVDQEIVVGDFLSPSVARETLSYVPRAPEQDLFGQVVALPEGLGGVGKPGFVTLDLGRDSRVEVGHVLAVYRKGGSIRDPRRYDDPEILVPWLEQTKAFFKPERYVALPDDRIGLVFVFRVFDRTAYGFVVDAILPVEVGDIVRRPGKS